MELKVRRIMSHGDGRAGHLSGVTASWLDFKMDAAMPDSAKPDVFRVRVKEGTEDVRAVFLGFVDDAGDATSPELAARIKASCDMVTRWIAGGADLDEVVVSVAIPHTREHRPWDSLLHDACKVLPLKHGLGFWDTWGEEREGQMIEQRSGFAMSHSYVPR